MALRVHLRWHEYIISGRSRQLQRYVGAVAMPRGFLQWRGHRFHAAAQELALALPWAQPRRRSPSPPRVGICTSPRFDMDATLLRLFEEWVTYHYALLGASVIHVYDTDGSLEPAVLRLHARMGIDTSWLPYWPRWQRHFGAQYADCNPKICSKYMLETQALLHCTYALRGIVEWAIVLVNIDEYVGSVRGRAPLKNLPTYLGAETLLQDSSVAYVQLPSANVIALSPEEQSETRGPMLRPGTASQGGAQTAGWKGWLRSPPSDVHAANKSWWPSVSVESLQWQETQLADLAWKTQPKFLFHAGNALLRPSLVQDLFCAHWARGRAFTRHAAAGAIGVEVLHFVDLFHKRSTDLSGYTATDALL